MNWIHKYRLRILPSIKWSLKSRIIYNYFLTKMKDKWFMIVHILGVGKKTKPKKVSLFERK